MNLHFPSLVFVQMLILGTLALCLELVARQKHGNGMRWCGAAFAAMCAVGMLCMLRPQANDRFFVTLASVFLTGALSLVLEGLAQAQGNKQLRLYHLWPIPAGIALFTLLPSQPVVRSALLLALLAFQTAQLGWTIAQRWPIPEKGQRFVLVGVAFAMASLLAHAGSVWASPEGARPSHALLSMQTLVFSMSCVAMVVSSFGLVVMLKERGDTGYFLLAFSDDLTGLHNRRYIRLALAQQIAQARCQQQPLSLLLIDVDFFKRINDAFGHLGGDQVLQELAVCLKAQLRASDIVGRWGGEEFIAILPHTDAARATALAERVRMGVQKNRFMVSGDRVHPVTVSIGLHSLESGVLADGQNMVAAADKALYLAKASGRNCAARM